jgi:hypothetical protein
MTIVTRLGLGALALTFASAALSRASWRAR